MQIDVSQFIQGFIEDSRENLEIAEQGLLTLDAGGGALDPEVINAIFRAVHSIKGMAGTFGMDAIASFTHVAENYLDLVRNGDRDVLGTGVTTLLESVDFVRVLFDLHGTDGEQGAHVVAQRDRLLGALQRLIDQDETASPEERAAAEALAASRWLDITIRPLPDLLTTGNDPVLLLRELAEFGDCLVYPLLDRLPAIDQLDPEQAYLGWRLALFTERPISAVYDVFDWVSEDVELTIIEADKMMIFETVEPVTLLASIDASRAEHVADATQSEAPTDADAGELANAEPSDWADVEATELGQAVAPEHVESDEPAPAQTSQDTPHVELPRAPAEPVRFEPVAEVIATSRAEQTAPNQAVLEIGVERLDTIVDLVGELIITRSVLRQLVDSLDPQAKDRLDHAMNQFERNTRDLQESVLGARMLPVASAFTAAREAAEETAARYGRRVECHLIGSETAVDRAVLGCLTQTLKELASNAARHASASEAERTDAGKPPHLQLELRAQHEGGEVVIHVSDDGPGFQQTQLRDCAIERGLLAETEPMTTECLTALVLKAGVSTDGGHGEGLSAVRAEAQALGGEIAFSERAVGLRATVRMPLSMAILEAQVLVVGTETYILPVSSIVETIQIEPHLRHQIDPYQEIYSRREESIPILDLGALLGVAPCAAQEKELLAIVECDGERMGFLVAGLLDQQQVVVKSLEENYQAVPGLSGATILGDGTVALILDVAGIMRLADGAAESTGRVAS